LQQFIDERIVLLRLQRLDADQPPIGVPPPLNDLARDLLQQRTAGGVLTRRRINCRSPTVTSTTSPMRRPTDSRTLAGRTTAAESP